MRLEFPGKIPRKQFVPTARLCSEILHRSCAESLLSFLVMMDIESMIAGFFCRVIRILPICARGSFSNKARCFRSSVSSPIVSTLRISKGTTCAKRAFELVSTCESEELPVDSFFSQDIFQCRFWQLLHSLQRGTFLLPPLRLGIETSSFRESSIIEGGVV